MKEIVLKENAVRKTAKERAAKIREYWDILNEKYPDATKGEKIATIAEQLNIHRQTVRDWLDRLDIAKKRGSRAGQKLMI